MEVTVDFHVHTDSSFDGRHSLEEMLLSAKEKGLNAIAICDHNIIFDPARLAPLPSGSLEGFLVIAGCEFSTDRGHILGLFLQDCPDLAPLFEGKSVADFHKTLSLIQSLGGIAVVAHPFARSEEREMDFCAELFGVEVANARAWYKNPRANVQALELGREYGKVSFGGSDAHSKGEIGNCYTTVLVEELSLDRIRSAVLSGKTQVVHLRNTKRIYKGASQLIKAKRGGGSLLQGILYYCYCILWDCFHPSNLK
ncbi:MAG: PHP-associated domain-containing protein [Eubacteriales bacterium]